MRVLIIIGAVAASTLLGGWAFDRQGPFCLFAPDFTNCGYPTWQACMEAASGVTRNFCRENPQYVPDRRTRRRDDRW